MSWKSNLCADLVLLSLIIHLGLSIPYGLGDQFFLLCAIGVLRVRDPLSGNNLRTREPLARISILKKLNSRTREVS